MTVFDHFDYICINFDHSWLIFDPLIVHMFYKFPGNVETLNVDGLLLSEAGLWALYVVGARIPRYTHTTLYNSSLLELEHKRASQKTQGTQNFCCRATTKSG